MSNEWRHARHYPIDRRSSYHIDEQGGRGQGDEMISRATPRSYPHQRDPPHPGSTPQETGREPFGWQNDRPNVGYLAAQPPSLGPIEYTQEMGDLPSRARFGDLRTSHRSGSMSVHPNRQPDRGNPYQDSQTNEILQRRLDHRRTSRGVEDLTGIEDFPLESSGTRDYNLTAIDDRQMDGSRGRHPRYYPGDMNDLTIGMDNVGLNETPTRPANHGQRDRAGRRERETDRRRHADSDPDSYDTRAGVYNNAGNGLDPTYQVQDRRFFKVGTVFSMLWHENAGQGTVQSQDIWIGRFGERVYSTIRRMVVVEEQRGCAWCLGIFTYNGQGVGKSGVDPSTHAVVFMKNTAPTTGRREPRMTKDPIAVVPVSRDKKLDPMSRINFAKIYTVEHNVKVKHIGEIDEGYVHRLMGYYSRGGSSRTIMFP